MKIVLENTGNIGKAYRRHDEIGTPFCITIDFDSIGAENSEYPGTATIRDRDTMKQIRIPIEDLIQKSRDLLQQGFNKIAQQFITQCE